MFFKIYLIIITFEAECMGDDDVDDNAKDEDSEHDSQLVKERRNKRKLSVSTRSEGGRAKRGRAQKIIIEDDFF